MIVKKNDKFQVRTKKGKVLGTHKSKKGAVRQLQAVELSKKRAKKFGNGGEIPVSELLKNLEQHGSAIPRDYYRSFNGEPIVNLDEATVTGLSGQYQRGPFYSSHPSQEAFEAARPSELARARLEYMGVPTQDPMALGAAQSVSPMTWLTPAGDLESLVGGAAAIGKGNVGAGALMMGAGLAGAFIPGTIPTGRLGKEATETAFAVPGSRVIAEFGADDAAKIFKAQRAGGKVDEAMSIISSSEADDVTKDFLLEAVDNIDNPNFDWDEWMSNLMSEVDLDDFEFALSELLDNPNVYPFIKDEMSVLYDNFAASFKDVDPSEYLNSLTSEIRQGERFTTDWFANPATEKRIRRIAESNIGYAPTAGELRAAGVNIPSSVSDNTRMIEDVYGLLPRGTAGFEGDLYYPLESFVDDLVSRYKLEGLSFPSEYHSGPIPGADIDVQGQATSSMGGYKPVKIDYSGNMTPRDAGRVGAHEMGHLSSDYGNNLIAGPIFNDVYKLAQRSKEELINNYGQEFFDFVKYAMSPQELAQYIQEVRFLLDLEPGQLVDPSVIAKNIPMLASRNPGRFAAYNAVFDYGLPNALSELINRLPAFLPVGIGMAGAASTLSGNQSKGSQD